MKKLDWLSRRGSLVQPITTRVMHFKNKKLEMGTHSCSPLAIDLGRGRLDLMVGEENGAVLYYPRENLSWINDRH